MAVGVQPFDLYVKALGNTFHEIVKPYISDFHARKMSHGFVIEIGLHYQDKTVVRKVGPFDIAEDFDDPGMRKRIGRALGEATMEAYFEMMDPTGELKTLSVKEVYANKGGTLG